MLPEYINLACGPVFIDSPAWANFDFAAASGVQQADLLGRLPLSDNSAQLVYSSHFLEHIPKLQVESFLRECLRVLKPGGALRLVLPDLENMARTYLQLRDDGEHEKADFVVLEMIDQCVRSQSGGELGQYYRTLQEQAGENVSTSSEITSMIDFIRHRTGEQIGTAHPSRPVVGRGEGAASQFKRLLINVQGRLQRYWVQAVLQALPSAFREQNISLAAVGERHHWCWDFHQLQQTLEVVGFMSVERRSAGTSAIASFPFYPLDLDADGLPRKGAESMYIEARKPR
jgi:predicted SAM-dependent methyltransferase